MKELVFKLSYALRLHIMVRNLFQKNKVTFLLFHELPQAQAEGIIDFLNRTYSVITLAEYVEHRLGKSNRSLPKFPLVITFDDGRKSNMSITDHFVKHGNRPTVYVCADRQELDGYPLFDDRDFNKAKEYYDLQAHTISHPDLLNTSDDDARHEISDCKNILESKLDLSITSFAYPYGWYTDRDVRLAEASGYSNAVTVDFGFNDDKTPMFKLKRICISDKPTVEETAIKTCGLWGFLKGKVDGY